MFRVPSSDFKPDYHDHVRHDVVPFVPRVGGSLLDVGGGIGATAAALKAAGIVDGAGVADIVDPQLAVQGLDFFCPGNLEDPEFLSSIGTKHGPFQVILALDVLEHLADPWSTVRTLAGMLAPNGYMVVSIPNVRHWRTSAGLLFRGEWEYRDDGILDRTHLRFFVRSTAEQLVQQGGLAVRSVNTTHASARARLLEKISLGALTDLMALQYVVVAQRLPGDAQA